MQRNMLNVIVALLLFVAPAARGAAYTSSVIRDEETPKLTVEEEREARGLARQFVERLRETNDVAPIVEDLFVKDLGERLRYDRDGIPMALVEPEVAKRATSDELRKFYIAEFNFYSLTLGYWGTPVSQPDAGDDDGETKLEDMFPPDVVRVLKSDPIIAAIIAKEEDEETDRVKRSKAADTETAKVGVAGEPAQQPRQQEESDDRFIKDIATLRAATTTAEKAAEALRAHVPPFSVLRRLQEATISNSDFEEVHAFYLDAPEEDSFYGLAPDTRLICGKVEPARGIQFHLVIIRVEGRLRILVAYPVLG